MSYRIVKSSGILDNFKLQAFLVNVKIANLDPDDDSKVMVQIIDWSHHSPVTLPVFSFNGQGFTTGDGGPIEIEKSTACSFCSFISGVFNYEVRITIYDHTENVISTSQGLQYSFDNVIGQTVLEHNFKMVDID